ncbi:hypothetical protein [Micromonospora tulbaghiae]|uniref:hypothetical protein n=1 Tax=Micromonospora tulbaghiae TaxID=479978 RepID=UPI003F4CB9EA
MRGEGGAARRSTGPAGRPSATRKSTAAKKTTAAKRTTSARRSATSPAKAAPAARATGARAKATGTRKAAPARAKATSARATTARAKAAPSRAKATSSRATATRSKAAPSRAKATSARAKAAPGRATAASSRAKAAPARAKAAPSRAKAAPARAKAAPARKAPTAPTRGPASSRSIGSSQLITSLADRPERPGRSLVTRDHEVIQRWARARGAKPATIAGTEREGRPGVLTFNIPGYRESSRIREITWDDWFRTFDLRRLNLIYQEQMRDGRQSNFFRTENPNREDG